jgi:hypothetical protein
MQSVADFVSMIPIEQNASFFPDNQWVVAAIALQSFFELVTLGSANQLSFGKSSSDELN